MRYLANTNRPKIPPSATKADRLVHLIAPSVKRAGIYGGSGGSSAEDSMAKYCCTLLYIQIPKPSSVLVTRGFFITETTEGINSIIPIKQPVSDSNARLKNSFFEILYSFVHILQSK